MENKLEALLTRLEQVVIRQEAAVEKLDSGAVPKKSAPKSALMKQWDTEVLPKVKTLQDATITFGVN